MQLERETFICSKVLYDLPDDAADLNPPDWEPKLKVKPDLTVHLTDDNLNRRSTFRAVRLSDTAAV